MFIATDGTSVSLPEDVRALSARVIAPRDTIDRGETQGGGIEEIVARPDSSHLLDRWNVQSHQYTTKIEVETSILGRLISAKGQASHYGIVQEAKRYCVRQTQSGRKVEFGTAVRLAVAIFTTEFSASLTLPNIAATAQLSDIRARIGLSVDGFIGPLGEYLPAPGNLNVENISVYTTAFKQIQAQVFGVAGLNFIAPALLGYETEEGASA